jgi:WXG100 family type VII secretion target
MPHDRSTVRKTFVLRRTDRSTLCAVPSLPDPDHLVTLAARVSAHAALARQEAHRLTGAAGAVTWSGIAAQAFDAQAAEIVRSLRRCADRLDDAADALRRHAAAVAHVLDILRRLGHDALEVATAIAHGTVDELLEPVHVVGDAVSAVGRLVGIG